MDYGKKALALHKKLRGKIEITLKTPIQDRNDLSLVYTPGVGTVSSYLGEHPAEANQYTITSDAIAVVSDGSAVLGLGNIGPQGALPVMEGKAALFKHFGNLNAWPIVLSTQDPDQIIAVVEAIAPGFAGINLEDFAAPKCFYIEQELKKRLNIPVMHDDQWGTAVVVLAGLINALKLTKREFKTTRFVMSGAGAAGMAIIRILLHQGAKNIVVVDSKGIVYAGREGNNDSKKDIAQLTNPQGQQGSLSDAFVGADVFIGVSQAGIVTPEMVASMNKDSIIFALANPVPEIMPDLAQAAGAAIVATGRSDFANQVNNALAFPGIFRGAIDGGITKIDLPLLTRAATALAELVKKPTPDQIIPSIFDKGVMQAVAKSVAKV